MQKRRAIAVAVLGAMIVALTTLAGADSDVSSTGTARPSRTMDYLPGRAADVYLPRQMSGTKVVVMLVPGGGWQTADRAGLNPLAARLAGAGMVAVNITYRAAADRVRFPAPVEDVACAAAFAAQQAASAVGKQMMLVVLGHSSGAHLAALLALSGNRFRSDCPYPSVTPDGFIGIAGPYDLRAAADVAVALFGTTPDQNPTVWREGDPLSWVASAPKGLRVLLLHGDGDTLVPPVVSLTFASQLRDAGVTVDLRTVRGADHLTVFQPSMIAPTVIGWIRELVASQVR